MIRKKDDRTGSVLTNEDELISKPDIISLEVKDVLQKVGTSERGLSSNEANERLDKYGTNDVAGKKKKSSAVRFVSYLLDPLTLILLIAGTLTFITGDMVDSTIIYIIVLLSSSLQFYQENKI